MSKYKLLQVMLVTGSLAIVGCSSTPTDDSGTSGETGQESTGSTTELMPLDEATETEQPTTRTVMPIETAPVEEAQSEPEQQQPSQNVVYFEFDSYSLDSETRSVLDEHVAYLRSDQAATVVLEGHTDERGSPEYNLALGENRAKAVQDYMNLRGVDNSRMYVTSFGEMNPVADGSNEEAWAQNRRVQVRYED